MKLSIGIKALNEEQHIAAALASAVAAAAPLGGEVILADSGSTDRTIEIARAFPVRIVQLAHVAEKCCGAGAQLAYQHARGDYFLLMDGDMELEPGFATSAIAYLDAHPDVAGVGGQVREINVANAEFEIRNAALARQDHYGAGLVDRLDLGGLFRASAIRDAGFFADRNLHAFEEFDLGTRLLVRGWKLARIAEPAIRHHGHVESGYALMWRRLRSGYAGAVGEVVRAAIAGRYLMPVLRRLSQVRHVIAVLAWWILLLASAIWAPLLLSLWILGPIAFLSLRRGNIRLGLYSFAWWNASTLAFFGGLCRFRTPPQRTLQSVDLTREIDLSGEPINPKNREIVQQ